MLRAAMVVFDDRERKTRRIRAGEDGCLRSLDVERQKCCPLQPVIGHQRTQRAARHVDSAVGGKALVTTKSDDTLGHLAQHAADRAADGRDGHRALRTDGRMHLSCCARAP